MIPGQFEYVRPGSLDETLQALAANPGEAKLISGGYSLLPLLKLRLAQPAVLVDLQDVPGLKGIVRTDDFVRIGSRTTHREIQESEELALILPIMREAAAGIGDAQVRNWGTIGGSVAHADPSSDWPAVLIATDASVVCRSVDGEREIAARSFFLDSFVTAIEPTEVLTEVRDSDPGTAQRRRLPEAGASGGRLLDGRRGRPAGPRRRRPDRQDRYRPHRRRRAAIRGGRRRGRDPRRHPERGPLRPGGRGGRGRKPPRCGCPRACRLQAGHGPRDDEARAAPGRCPRGGPIGGPRGRERSHEAHHADRQRRDPGSGRRAAPPARPPSPRRLPPDRHAHRLRHQQLRCVHGPCQRREREVLHDARRPGGRRSHHDHRGPRPRRRAASAAAGVLGPARPAVRLLHSGHDHAGRLAARERPGPHREPRSARASPATSAAARAT